MIVGHGDDLWRFGRTIVANFSSNVYGGVDLTALKEHLAARLEAISHYPEPEPYTLERALAALHGIAPECVCVTNGATEAIYLIAQAWRGSRSCILQPTFSEYADACRLHGHYVRPLGSARGDNQDPHCVNENPLCAMGDSQCSMEDTQCIMRGPQGVSGDPRCANGNLRYVNGDAQYVKEYHRCVMEDTRCIMGNPQYVKEYPRGVNVDPRGDMGDTLSIKEYPRGDNGDSRGFNRDPHCVNRDPHCVNRDPQGVNVDPQCTIEDTRCIMRGPRGYKVAPQCVMGDPQGDNNVIPTEAGRPRGGISLLWLCNPNNPDGRVIPKEQLLAQIANNPDTIFVIDQSYGFFTEEPLLTPAEAIAAGNVLQLHSMTKRYAMPGLRLGYITGSQSLIDRIRNVRMPWSVNALAIEAGLYLTSHPDTAPIDKPALLKEAQRLRDELNAIPGLSVEPTKTHFMLCHIENGTAAELKHYLAENHGLLIRDASNFEGLDAGHFRIAAQTREENDMLVKAIKEYLLR